MRYFALLPAVLLLCSCGDKPATVNDFNTRDLTLPGGQVIKVETMMDVKDMLRGLMFRPSLDADRGMLFIHRAPGRYSYFMYQHLIPLDIIWMDASRQVVEIVADAQPCQSVASKCPHYGGHEDAKFVLEIGAGLAKKYGMKTGDYITF